MKGKSIRKPGFLSAARAVDLLVVVFVFVLISLSLIFRVPNAGALTAVYSALIVVQLALINKKGHFRDIVFPVICIVAVFESLGTLVGGVNPGDMDDLLIKIDYLLFGGYPTVMLEGISSPLLTEAAQIAYFTYYFIPITLGAVLKLRGMEEKFQRSLFLIVYCFFLSYLGYILVPALGPRYVMAHLQGAELSGMFLAVPIQELLNGLEGIKRDAFPSGHTAVTLLVLWLSYRYDKKLFLFFLPVVSMLVFSTVYCRYHYAIDVIAGAALAFFAMITGNRLYESWHGDRPPPRA